MITNAQFSHSITMSPKEFKAKYESDTEFWEKDGKEMCENMKDRLEQMKIAPVELTEEQKKINEFKG